MDKINAKVKNVDDRLSYLEVFRKDPRIGKHLSQETLDEAWGIAIIMAMNVEPDLGLAKSVVEKLETALKDISVEQGILCKGESFLMSTLWTRAELCLSSTKCINNDLVVELTCICLMSFICTLTLTVIGRVKVEAEEQSLHV